jgi:hypothetical protein
MEDECECRRCIAQRGKPFMRMIVCATCGNKRCPHATDHTLACTDSNEPGQPGSHYAARREGGEAAS